MAIARREQLFLCIRDWLVPLFRTRAFFRSAEAPDISVIPPIVLSTKLHTPKMPSQSINLLVSTFPGLRLPSTLCLPVPASSTIADICTVIARHLPTQIQRKVIVTTLTNHQLLSTSNKPLTTLLSNPDDSFLTLRLSVPLCGGKGGFGSQLRAAGGKMSSRKRRQQGEQNGSSRNLDGRRLRTVAEAKALAEYLAIKPEMDKREKEERRKRWQAIVDMAEKKTEEMKDGGKTRLDSKYFETLEETTEKTRMAVLSALAQGQIKNVFGSVTTGSAESDESAETSGDTDDDESDEVPAVGPSEAKKPARRPRAKKLFGWDDDDDMSDDDEDEEDEDEDEQDEGNHEGENLLEQADVGKGKAKA